ncbi:MAG: universal stress protein [Anaerolineae bacterium]|nr:universal stress protein [Anaerolineae bacterium]
MAGIVCAIRGGPDSRPTIDKAFEMARQSGLPVHFLYVVNLDFLARTASSRIQVISQEMRDMGEFILLSAQDAANAAGVEADGTVRDGNVLDEMAALCRELDADYLIIGVPKLQNEENVFSHEQLPAYVEHLRSATGAEVVMAGGETV